MIGRLDQHEVKVFLFQHVAVVTVGARFLFRGLARGDHVRGFREHSFIHVAKRHHLDGRNLNQAKQVTFAVPAAADEADAFFHVGKVGGVMRECRQGQRGGGAGLEKCSAVHENPFNHSPGQIQVIIIFLQPTGPVPGIGR